MAGEGQTDPALVRRATAADAGGLTDLLLAMGWFGWMAQVPREEVAAVVGRQLALALGEGQREAHTVFVADHAGTIRGYLSVHWMPYLIRRGAEGFVSELFVHPDARGMGVGSRLLDAAVAEGRARGAERLSLLNSRKRDSYERGFYSSRGWEERPDFANFVFFL